MNARQPASLVLLGLAALLAAPRYAAGLATEQLGSDPINPGLGFGAQVLAAVNTPARVYWYEVNGNPFFFFRGTVREANEAIRRFAAIPAGKREIILLPGPGETGTLTGTTHVPYDWCLHTPLGLRFMADAESSDDRNTLTIHIAAPRPPAKADPADVRRWVADLSSDRFKTREQAVRSLEGLGSAAAPALREALKSAASAEARERIERLIGRLRRIELDLLELPADIPVVGIETLLERGRKDLSNKEPQVRGYAATGLARRCVAAKDVMSDLVKLIETDKDEYVLRCAASALARLGGSARPALPALRKQAEASKGAVREALEHAAAVIEKKEKAAAPDDAGDREVIRRQIADFVKARSAKKGR